MRLFIAIDLPEQLQFEIETLCLPELKEVRWSSSDQRHLTLLFIGEQPNRCLDEIIEAISEVRFTPLEISLKSVGHFKSGILYLNVEENTALNALHQRLYQKLLSLGIQLEKRKFKAHITLGRYKNPDPLTLQAFESHGQNFSGKFLADSFSLKSSQLKNTGAEYLTEADFLPD